VVGWRSLEIDELEKLEIDELEKLEKPEAQI
jgi:hypothetical protein